MIQITMHRGDYLKKKINILDPSGSTVNIDFDEIYVTFKNSAFQSDFLFQKKLSDGRITKNEDGSYSFEILPEDTDNLKFGEYEFDIELYRASPIFKQTFLGKLELLEEVTHAINE